MPLVFLSAPQQWMEAELLLAAEVAEVSVVAAAAVEVALASGAQFACQQQPSEELGGTRGGGETICYLPFAARVLCHFNFRRGQVADGKVGWWAGGRWVLIWAPETELTQ